MLCLHGITQPVYALGGQLSRPLLLVSSMQQPCYLVHKKPCHNTSTLVTTLSPQRCLSMRALLTAWHDNKQVKNCRGNKNLMYKQHRTAAAWQLSKGGWRTTGVQHNTRKDACPAARATRSLQPAVQPIQQQQKQTKHMGSAAGCTLRHWPRSHPPRRGQHCCSCGAALPCRARREPQQRLHHQHVSTPARAAQQ